MTEDTRRIINQITRHLSELMAQGVSLEEDVDLKSGIEEVLLDELDEKSARALREDLPNQDTIEFIEGALAKIYKADEWDTSFRSLLMDSLDTLFLLSSPAKSKAFLASLG